MAPGQLKNQELWIDGFNVLTGLEAALSGGVILIGRDGCFRDLASADSVILDHCQRWLNLTRLLITSCVPRAIVVDLSAVTPPDN